MELCTNDVEFDKRQRTLTGAIIRFIKDDLEAVGLSKEQVRELTANIAFRVASILDGSQIIYQRSSGQRLQPVVMFADDPDHKKLVTHKGVHSFMHEYVHAFADVAFKQP